MGRIRTAAAKKFHKNVTDNSENSSDEETLSKVKKSVQRKPGPKSRKPGPASKTKRSATRQSTSSVEVEPIRRSRRSNGNDEKNGKASKNGDITIPVTSDSSSDDEQLVETQKLPKSKDKSPPKVGRPRGRPSTSTAEQKGNASNSRSPKKRKAEDDRYEVEDIIDHKIEDNVKYFLIRWKGYGSDVDSWERQHSISCPALKARYYEKNPEARMPAKPKNKRKKKIELPPVRQLKIDEQVDYDSEWDETEDFEVERIIDVRFCRDNTREFLIRWKGYSANSDSWEPEANLDCQDLIEKFMTKLDQLKEVTHKELRPVRTPTQRFTLMTQADARRLSKRNVGRQRAVYYDCED